MIDKNLARKILQYNDEATHLRQTIHELQQQLDEEEAKRDKCLEPIMNTDWCKERFSIGTPLGFIDTDALMDYIEEIQE